MAIDPQGYPVQQYTNQQNSIVQEILSDGTIVLITGVTISTGSGSPNNVVTAPVGSWYTDKNGVAPNIWYQKQTGAGNTGWVAIGAGGAVTPPGGANTQIQFNNSGAFGGDTNFAWDNTNKQVFIGGVSPTTSAELTIIGAAAGNAANPIEIHSQVGGLGIFDYMHINSAANAANFILFKSRGTQALPLAINSGDNLGYIDFAGYDGTTYAAPVLITSQATNGFTSTIHGASLDFNVTLPGANNAINAFRLGNTVGISVSALDFGVASGKVLGLGNTPSVNTLLDAGFSRLAGASVALGNGTAGDASGKLTLAKLKATGLQIFANNAAAITGGLLAGDFYRTGADPDVVCVVH